LRRTNIKLKKANEMRPRLLTSHCIRAAAQLHPGLRRAEETGSRTPTEAGTVEELVGQIEAQKREVERLAGEVESRKERLHIEC